MSWEFERVAGPFAFTEGPVWDGDRVLFSDIPNSRIVAYDATTDDHEVVRTETNRANGLKFGPDGHLYVCEGSTHRVARYGGSEDRETVVESYRGTRLNRPNDLAFGPDGTLWFTDPDYTGSDDVELDHYSVYRADRTGSGWDLARVTDDTVSPNGILVSPDGERLYVAESDYDEPEHMQLRAYPIESDGSLGRYRVLHNFYPHRAIDGMCFDDDGDVVATAGWDESGPGPMLYVFAPSGRVLETHPCPTPPTNCAFGGDDLSTLYVTAQDGCLYAVDTDRTGYLGPPNERRFP